MITVERKYKLGLFGVVGVFNFCGLESLLGSLLMMSLCL